MSRIQRMVFLGVYLLCPILLFLMGGAMLLYQLGKPSLRLWLNDEILRYLPWYASIVWWTLLMVVPLFLLLLSLRRPGVLVFKTESVQPLRIRESAVSRYLYDRLMALPYIRNARISSASRGGALALKVRVWVVCRKPLNNIQDRVLDHLIQDARQGFGISKILPPDVQFESVKASKTAVEDREEVETEAPAAPLLFGREEPAPPANEEAPAPETSSPNPEKKWEKWES